MTDNGGEFGGHVRPRQTRPPTVTPAGSRRQAVADVWTVDGGEIDRRRQLEPVLMVGCCRTSPEVLDLVSAIGT